MGIVVKYLIEVAFGARVLAEVDVLGGVEVAIFKPNVHVPRTRREAKRRCRIGSPTRDVAVGVIRYVNQIRIGNHLHKIVRPVATPQTHPGRHAFGASLGPRGPNRAAYVRGVVVDAAGIDIGHSGAELLMRIANQPTIPDAHRISAAGQVQPQRTAGLKLICVRRVGRVHIVRLVDSQFARCRPGRQQEHLPVVQLDESVRPTLKNQCVANRLARHRIRTRRNFRRAGRCPIALPVVCGDRRQSGRNGLFRWKHVDHQVAHQEIGRQQTAVLQRFQESQPPFAIIETFPATTEKSVATVTGHRSVF